jgi:elongation factor G
MEVSAIRNIAFVGHPSSGKTTFIDGLAHALGASDRKGSVAEKTSLCDTEPEEQEKGHTLQMKVIHADHGGLSWNLFDTPGYPDFMGDTVSAMYASDLVVAVVSCSSGVTFNVLQKMKLAAELGRGRAIIVTHLDGENASFEALVEELREKVGECCVPIQVPDKSGPGFSAVSRVLEDASSEWRRPLMDAVMDACEDEELMMSYLDGKEPTDDQLDSLAPSAITAGSVVPILVSNPVTDIGLPQAIRFLSHFAPSPEKSRPFEAAGEPVLPDADGDFLGTVFAVRSDPHVGRISAVRVLRGKLSASDHVWSGTGKPEKLGGLFHLVGGKRRDNVDVAVPGEIVAFSKVEGVGFGDAVVLGGSEAPTLKRPEPPTPMVSLAITPKSRADEQKIGEALHKLEAEDPTFRIEQTRDTHEMVAHGMSDLHLQVIEARLKRRFGVEIETALPKIAYKETISRPAEGHHRHKKQSGGRGQFGECYIRIKPGAKDSGYVFVDEVTGGSIPRNLIPAVDKGMREVCEKGVLTHNVVVDVEAAVYDGKFHAVDSDEMSFKKAGAAAFRDAFMKAGPQLLEPVMEMEIHIPTDDAGVVFSDITSHRRGQVVDQTSEGGGSTTVVRAHVPLSTVLTYHRDLKSQTAGEGYYTMHLDHYAPMPAAEQQKVLKEIGRKHEEE